MNINGFVTSKMYGKLAIKVDHDIMQKTKRFFYNCKGRLPYNDSYERYEIYVKTNVMYYNLGDKVEMKVIKKQYDFIDHKTNEQIVGWNLISFSS